VIPNGFDLSVFRPDPSARVSVRSELKLEAESLLVGMFGRNEPQKDHGTFMSAASKLLKVYPNIHFVLCGNGVTAQDPTLTRWIEMGQLGGHCHLLGPRSDIPRLTAALDVATLSSAFGEAFPLVVGEAMASGVSCVATDVGDSALMIGDTGRIVPIRNPEAFARAIEELLHLGPEGRTKLGQAARARIARNFDIRDIVAAYNKVHRACAQHDVALTSN
jgi:glycosyltransferase involved in cell wall biosynthesis